MREAKELSEATSDYYAQPLSDNLFEWHFTVRIYRITYGVYLLIQVCYILNDERSTINDLCKS